jgi:Raf kinase inhibitor-like YbhB/YbcL family protein
MQSIYVTSKQNYLNLKFFLSIGGGNDTSVKISSDDIADGGVINIKYAKKHGNISPHIKIDNVPGDTKQLVLLMYDPDAKKVVGKVFLHWFVVLSLTETNIPENKSIGQQMLNDYNERGYGGPNPPSGQKHTYHFRAYAITDNILFDPDKTYSFDTLSNMLEKYSSSEFTATYLSD